MSLPKASSTKSKDGFSAGHHHHHHHHHHMSSFDRANQMLQELESFIESELAETPQLAATYESIARAKSKRKRNGPYLIKPLNKSKARKTYNDMEFDTVLGIWVGNNEDRKIFGQPALITDKSKSDKIPKTYGNMEWDPKEGKWKGNDQDLRRFEHKKVPLISNKNIDTTLKEINGMTFNPVTMVWEGNNDELLDFGTISDSSPSKDDGFVVGTEFQLSPATTQLFAECAARHIASTSGWWREEKSREHLMVIRTMSIMRVVRDIKRGPMFDEEPADMDIATEREVPLLPLKSPRAEPETDFDDAWDEVGPFNGTVRIKLRENMSPLDIDVELDQELNKEDASKKFGSVSNRSGTKAVVTEDWDEDFADLSKALSTKIKNYRGIPNFNNPADDVNPATPPQQITPVFQQITPQMLGTVTKLGKGGGTLPKRPFDLLKMDAPHRRSFHNLHESNKAVKLAWEEEDEDGLEIPAEPLKLKLERAPSVSSEVEDDRLMDDDDEEDTAALHSPPDEFDDVEVEEEDWGDVEVPASFGEPVTRRPSQSKQPPPPEKEEWDDLGDVPAKLVLKIHPGSQPRHHKSHKNLRQDDEEWDGLDIPDGAKLQLKR